MTCSKHASRLFEDFPGSSLFCELNKSAFISVGDLGLGTGTGLFFIIAQHIMVAQRGFDLIAWPDTLINTSCRLPIIIPVTIGAGKKLENVNSNRRQYERHAKSRWSQHFGSEQDACDHRVILPLISLAGWVGIFAADYEIFV